MVTTMVHGHDDRVRSYRLLAELAGLSPAAALGAVRAHCTPVPEGDTLFKTAARLRPALQGHALTRFEAPRLRGDAPKLGERIDLVEARGKHLLIHFERRAGAAHPPAHDRLVARVPRARAVAEAGRTSPGPWSAPTAAGWRCASRRRSWRPTTARRRRAGGAGRPRPRPVPRRRRSTDAVLDEIVERAGRLGGAGTTLGEALLDQRIAAGIGNVYKSEACFAVGVDPATPIERRRRADPPPACGRSPPASCRPTSAGPSAAPTPPGLAVYGRRGQPCRRCGTPIRMARHGELARSTYWCPTCQPPPAPNFVRHFTRGG